MSSERQPGTRLAVLVSGPPSSGNRWVASIFVACGLFGYGSSDQPNPDDLVLWSQHERIVLVVHNGLRDWILRLEDLGYLVKAVVVVRDPYVTQLSQRVNGHVTSSHQGVVYDEIRDLCARGVQWEIWPYEALIQRPEARQAMCARLGLELKQDVEVKDGNERYYAHPEAWRVGLVP